MYEYNIRQEREYQNKVVALFKEELHYEYLGKLQYAANKDSLDEGRKNSPVIEEELRDFLSRSEAGYTTYQIGEAIRQVKELTRLNDNRKIVLLQKNNSFYDTLISHLAIQPDAEHPHKNVRLIDFDNPEANHYAIAEEVSYIDPLTGSHCRPDLVVYVNGIALAVIELKRSTVSLDEGIRQNLSNEQDLMPSFFTTVQFTVAASDKNGFKYATILTPLKFWCPWKKDDHTTGTRLSDMESFRLFFDKQTFFNLIRYGVINDGGTKKVMRPHQYHALIAAMPRLKEKADGVIWHSQGSGKSLTMVWLARYIRRNFENPRVLIITDRTELDKQIANTFLGASESIHRAKTSDDLLSTLQSGQEWLICSLIHKFGRHIDPNTGEEIIGDDDAPIPMEKYLKELENLVNSKYGGKFETKGTNKFVFVDECHRTQGGRLHYAMRQIMGVDVMFIGFTGTPLLRSQKESGVYTEYKKVKNMTENRFGPFIHKYLHKEAVDDKVILDLQYEARDVEQTISDKNKLDAKLDQILKETNEEYRQKIKDRWATIEKVYSSKERIERIGYSILDDMSIYPLNQDWCNAMLVAGNIYSAYKYYQFFQEADNTMLRGKCAVVTSYTPSDYDLRKQEDGDDETQQEKQFKNRMARKSYEDLGVKNADQYETLAKEYFVKLPSQMKLLIVVDKLLTGFDAPSATYLYIDKDMRDHNLFQAICRVNRLGVNLNKDKDNPDSETIFTHKEFGLIVDFKHLFNKLKDAVTNFNDACGGLGGFDEEDIEGLLEDALSKNKKRLDAALAAYEALKSDWESKSIHTADDIVAYYNPFPDLDLDENKRNALLEEAKQLRMAFYKITQDLITAYANIADYIIRAGYAEEKAEEIRKTVSNAINLSLRVKQAAEEDFDVRTSDPKMRQLLDRYIRAEDAETIIPATADFSFLDLLTNTTDTDDVANEAVKEAGSQKAASEIIVAKARAVINDWNSKDKATSLSFAKRLQEIIDKINKETEDTTKEIKALIELLKEMKAGGLQVPEGITSPFAKTLWNNRIDWTNVDDEAETIALINKIEDFFGTKVFSGWKDTTNISGMHCIKQLRKALGNTYSDAQIYEIHRIAANNLNQE